MDNGGYNRPIRGDMLDFFNERPDKLIGLRVCGDDKADLLGSKSDYICDGTADQVEINLALVEARTLGIPVILMGEFYISGSIIMKTGDYMMGFPTATIKFSNDIVGANLIMIEIQDEYPSVRLENLNLYEGDKSVTNNDVEALIETTELGMSGMCQLAMTSCILWVDYATGILSDCIQGYIQHSKIASNVSGKHGTGISIPYAYNLTIFDMLIGGLAKAISFDGDVGATTLIGVTVQGCTAAITYTGTINIIGPWVEGNKFKNSGTATITSDNTDVTVTHGLSFTPTNKNIIVYPTNSMGTATKYNVPAADIGATTFKIKVDQAPGATTATFQWIAQWF